MNRKNILALLLACCLLMPLAVSVESRVPAAPTLGSGSHCQYKGQLLRLQPDGLHKVEDDGSSRPWASMPEGTLLFGILSDGERLYGLDAEDKVYPLTVKDGLLTAGEGVTLRNELSDDPGEIGTRAQALVLLGDRLYAFYLPQGGGGWSGLVFAQGLQGGPSERLPLSHPQAIAADDRGRLLYLSFDAQAAAIQPGQAEDRPRLFAYNPEDGSSEALVQLSQPVQPGQVAIAWDREDQSLLYLSHQRIYRRHGDGKETFCAFLPGLDIAMQTNPLLALSGQRIALMEGGSLVLREARGVAQDIKPLTLYGITDKSIHDRVLKAMPGQLVSIMDGYWNEPARLAELLQGAGEVDVLYLSSHSDELTRLVDKGYLMDLSGQEAIAAHIRRCEPVAQAPGQRGDKLFLMPVHMDSRILFAYPGVFKAAGKEIPGDFPALCRFMDTWAREDVDRLADYLPLLASSPRMELLNLALQLCFLEQEQRGEAHRFDAPLMRGLLEGVLEAHLEPLDRPEGDVSYLNKDYLIAIQNYGLSSQTQSSLFDPSGGYQPLLLPAQADGQPVMPVIVGYLAVAANAHNPEAALQYLAAYQQLLSHETRLLLYPDFNDPLAREGAAQMKEAQDARIGELEKQLQQASGADKTELEAQLAQVRKDRELQDRLDYQISPEVIAAHKARMQHARLVTRQLYMGWLQPDISALLQRLYDKQIGLDQFIQEAQSKLRLMQLEEK